jgi:NADPH-dependent 2,4-dienoyl-CoA reductase/sulfur reductase-like enzyme/rhodanese-related sulfurtransferase
MKVIVIGGVAGGMSAATRLRRLDESAEIIVLERSHHVSYANCGLPYFVGGIIEDEETLLLQTPESLRSRFRLDVRVRTEALSIDADAKTVQVRDLENGDQYSLDYDKLVLSPGATAIVPELAGIERAFILRTVEDVERIVARVEQRPKSAVVIGGGFIGLEVAENLVHRGIRTAVIEATSQIMAPLDPEMAALVAEEMQTHGVNLFLGQTVEALEADSVRLVGGQIVEADLVIVAIGVRPDVSLARLAKVEIGPRGGILVDDFNLTSDPSIYAIGDAAEKHDSLDASATLAPLANIANRQGRVVADHICGRTVRVVPTIATAIVKVFDLVAATTGWNEKRLVAAGRGFLAIHTHPTSHASYYPDAKPMALKLLVDPATGAVLGAQGVGAEGVDKRIDVLATAIRGAITAPELADLELAYAPPFGSAKDPVNMLGYIAENRLTHLSDAVQWSEVSSRQASGYLVLDVRSSEEFAQGSVPGAMNIPLDELRDRLEEIPSKQLVVTCQVGQRGHIAALLLNEKGFHALNLDGGYETWSHSPAAALGQLVR